MKRVGKKNNFMSNKNQFTVDLGNLELTDAQRTSINGAIQKAVMNEMAGYDLTKRNYCILFPHPPLCGIFYRPIEDLEYNKLVR
jgi:hypothetical protein